MIHTITALLKHLYDVPKVLRKTKIFCIGRKCFSEHRT